MPLLNINVHAEDNILVTLPLICSSSFNLFAFILHGILLLLLRFE